MVQFNRPMLLAVFMGSRTTTKSTPVLPVEKGDSWAMFNRIAKRYDLLNRGLSLGVDKKWRRQVAREMPLSPNLKVLDVATGTADLLVEVLGSRENLSKAVGVDKAEGMLALGRKKLKKLGLDSLAELQVGDAMQLNFKTSTYDVITVGFGVRNLPDPEAALKEWFRVLKPGGRLMVLEFSIPRAALVRIPYMLYLQHVLPRLGGLVSGSRAGYGYLAKTIKTFPYGSDFLKWMRASGFSDCTCKPMTFGVVSLYVGCKK